MSPAIRDRLVASALLGVGTIYLAAHVEGLPYDLADEGYLDYVAWRVHAGDVPFVDVELFSYFPGLFYALSWIWGWSADPTTAIRTVSALLFACNATLIWWLGCRLEQRAAALACAIALILVPGPWDRSYVATLNLSVLLGATYALSARRASPAAFACLGFLVGAGLWLRADFAYLSIAVLAACAVLVHRRDGMLASLGWATLGATAPLVALAVLLTRDGILAEFAAQVGNYLGFAAERTAASYRLDPPGIDRLTRASASGAFAWLYFASILVPAALAAVVARRLLAWRFASPMPTELAVSLVVLGWLAGNLPQYLWERPDPEHLCQRAFALIAGALWLLRLLDARAPRRAIATLGAVLLAAYVGVYAGRWQNGHYWFRGAETRSWTLDNGMRFTAVRAAWPEFLNAVLRDTRPDEPVATLPYAPGLNVLLRRRMPGRQVYLVPHSRLRPDAQARYVEDLERWPVRYVLWSRTFRMNARDASRFARYAPRIDEYLRCHYEERMSDRRIRLLERTVNRCR